jgi:Tfp pilus assembly protein PilN
LLPVARAFRPLAAPAMRRAALVMALVLVVSVGWAISMKQKTDRYQRDLTRVEAQITKLTPELELLRAAKATEQELRSEVERQTARIAKERAVRWSQILVDIAERFPEGIWLTQVNSPDTSKISFTGMAMSRELIPKAIESLSGSPYLSNVVLGSLTKDDQYAPGRTVIRFQLTAALRRGLVLAPGEDQQAGAAPAATSGEEVAQ